MHGRWTASSATALAGAARILRTEQGQRPTPSWQTLTRTILRKRPAGAQTAAANPSAAPPQRRAALPAVQGTGQRRAISRRWKQRAQPTPCAPGSTLMGGSNRALLPRAVQQTRLWLASILTSAHGLLRHRRHSRHHRRCRPTLSIWQEPRVRTARLRVQTAQLLDGSFKAGRCMCKVREEKPPKRNPNHKKKLHSRACTSRTSCTPILIWGTLVGWVPPRAPRNLTMSAAPSTGVPLGVGR